MILGTKFQRRILGTKFSPPKFGTFAHFGQKNIEIQDARTWENFFLTFFHHDKHFLICQ